ncbi:MAG: effector binding domain-containing protein [Oscillospiraceae bacterium]|nr:effector binding domain-containing protein [Oscillospiraceae bacterium]
MLRIGQAAKQFDLSNRTLRYWEEMGILHSERADNGYRYYDSENERRIQQIVLLRTLQLPIAEIERIFLSQDVAIAVQALSAHASHLRQESADLNDLAQLVEELRQRLTETPDLLQALLPAIAKSNKPRLKSFLSERIFVMPKKLDNVRIVRLPAMTVAAYRAESATPENDCAAVHDKFVRENNLHQRSCFRQFGFNNPNPSEGNPIYGYELWVTIPDDFDVPAPLEKKQFGGGLYASIPTHMNEIGERWTQLYHWAEKSDQYRPTDAHQWLEECIDFETFNSPDAEECTMQLDLLLPIKPKLGGQNEH